MSLMNKLLGTSALAIMCATAGCDASKPELEATKQTLQTVTGERDGLKTQLAAANQQMAGLRAQVTDLQAKLAAAAAPAPAPEAAAEPKKEEKAPAKKGAKAAKAEPKAAPAPTPAPAPGATTGPATEGRKGRGHF
jgi:uncharacterized protein (DUF3084 family)